ncbi:hypothetical protein [Halorubrum trueperi]|uniref:Uncharacterized protein n=1 Tax=Halorubrum trueperi TaxID=2004704 RepID=A0ABD5UEN6_9EURY
MTRSEDRGLSNSPNGDSSTDAEILDSDEPAVDAEHIPAPTPHVGGKPPREYELFGSFQIDAGGNAWVAAKYPVDVTEVR